MKNWLFISLMISFLIGYVAGAKTFSNPKMVEYKFLGNEIEECNRMGGFLTTKDNLATCGKNDVLFEINLNREYFDGK